jgi:hypothetical protein
MPTNANRDDPIAREVRHRTQLAEVGASDKTPLILLGRVWLACAALVAVVLAVTLLAYRLAS